MLYSKKDTTLTLGVYHDHIKKFGYLHSIIKRNQPVYCSSFPLKLVGEIGSRQNEMLYNFSYEFISKNKGLIFIESRGNTAFYVNLFSIARYYDRTDDFYILNLMSCTYDSYVNYKNGYLSHSINLINPIVDNKDAFFSMTQSPFSIVLQSLCKSIASNGYFVTIEHLKSFCSLESLVNMLSDSTFDSSHAIIDAYLHDIGYYLNLKPSNTTHLSNISFYTNFLKTAEHYPFMFSDKPDIDIESIYNQKKILLVLLPSLEIHVPEISILPELLSYQLLDIAYKDCNAGVIFDEYSFYLKDRHLIDFFTHQKESYLKDERKIIFSSRNFSSDPNQITSQYCSSFLLLQADGYTFDKNYMTTLMNKRLRPYIEAYIDLNRITFCRRINDYYSALFISFKKDNSLNHDSIKKDADFVVVPISIRYKKIVLADFCFINRKPLTKFHSLKEWGDPFFSKFY